MQKIIIGGRQFSFADVKEKGTELLNTFPVRALDRDDNTNNFSETLLLAQQWLKGEETFTFHTSGSTGVPKPIELKRKQLEASARATIETLGITSNDHIFHCLPTAFIGGAMLLIRGLIAQCDVTIVPPSTTPIETLPKQHTYTVASFTPMQLYSILNPTQPYESILSPFKILLIGGSAIDVKLESKLALLENISIYHTYGMTETVSHIALRKIGGGNLFKTLPGIEIRINEHNCLCIKGDVTEQKWIETNDITHIINQTSFEILGRLDDVINSGGVKILPKFIEETIGEYLQIVPSNICALGLPDVQLGQKLIVVIQGSKPIKLYKHQLVKMLAGYQIPKAFYQLQAFPLTATGKLNKPELLKMLPLAQEIPLR